MVGEVNKLIFNTLISEGAVHLPDVGVIYLNRVAATEVARDRVATPRISVQFSSQMKATSLIDVISNVASVDSAQAKDIYFGLIRSAAQMVLILRVLARLLIKVLWLMMSY